MRNLIRFIRPCQIDMLRLIGCRTIIYVNLNRFSPEYGDKNEKPDLPYPSEMKFISRFLVKRCKGGVSHLSYNDLTLSCHFGIPWKGRYTSKPLVPPTKRAICTIIPFDKSHNQLLYNQIRQFIGKSNFLIILLISKRLGKGRLCL